MAGSSSKAAGAVQGSDRLTRWRGRYWLAWARLLQASGAGRTQWRSRLDRRNSAMHKAHRNGVTADAMAARLGMSRGWVTDILKKPQPEQR